MTRRATPPARVQTQRAAGASGARLGLGTARFGAGAGFPRGRLSPPEAAALMRIAAESGIERVDAALAAPETDALLGPALPRPSPFRLGLRAAGVEGGPDVLEAEVRTALRRLGLDAADALMVSAADLLTADGKALWARLRTLRDEGLIARAGIYADPEDDPLGLARRFKPDVMQLPVSLLDQRLVASGALAEVAALGVDVQLRAIFLQGLLFQPRHGLAPELAAAGPSLSRIRLAMAEAGADPLQASLAFALGLPEVSAVLVAAGSVSELRAVLAAAAAPAPDLDWRDFALDHALGLSPEQWAAA